jgi:hypothetical protein
MPGPIAAKVTTTTIQSDPAHLDFFSPEPRSGPVWLEPPGT